MKKIRIHPLTKPEPVVPQDGKTVYVVSRQECVQSYREDKPYGDWKDTYESEVVRLTKDKPNTWDFESFEVDNTTYNADKAYIIAVTYSDGDTFGSASGKLCVYKVLGDLEQAKKIACDIDKYGSNYNEHVKDEFPSFCGYFESVERVELLEMEYE